MLPKAIKIGGMVYQVKIDQTLAITREKLGEYVPFYQEIVIASGAPEDQQNETLLHEIIEAVNNHCELRLEHHQIQTLSFQLHQVLKDNGLFFGGTTKEVGCDGDTSTAT